LILVDANLLVYAHVTEFKQHEAAREWLNASLTDRPRVALPWQSLVSFLRLVTNPRVFERPEPVSLAWDQITEWLAAPSAWTPVSTERHASILGDLLRRTESTGNLVPDANLAALAIGHGLTLCSTDRDFARFPGLRWINPIADR
jgi:toxin-antitoxin system PIN domain toxin